MNDPQPKKRSPSRRKSVEKTEHPVESFTTTEKVPPLNCPKCGRGMEPRVIRTKNGVSNCTCRLCGKPFDYQHPKIFTKNE